MEDKELRRGDYVMFFNKHKIGKIAKVDQTMRYSCLLLYDEILSEDGKHYFEDEIIVNYEDIKPIELTHEITSQVTTPSANGYWELTPNLYIEGNELYCAMHPNNEMISLYNEQLDQLDFLTKETFYTKICDVKYVHKLQHILKDFEIIKEIVL